MENKITTREWLPLIGMTVSAFIFNTSEFMPIGLLSDIAADFRMTEAQADSLLRADLRKLYKMCSRFGKDALLAQCCPIMSDITG